MQRRPQLDVATCQNLSLQIARVIVQRVRADAPTSDLAEPSPAEAERFLEVLFSAHARPPG